MYSTAGCRIGRLAEIFRASLGIARFAREGIQHEAAAAFDGHDARFPIGIEEGATLVRVGTAIFGKRSKKQRKPQMNTDFHRLQKLKSIVRSVFHRVNP